MTIPYFMDECTFWEVDNILDCLPYCDRNLWESQRLLALIDAKSHFKNIKNYQDIATFEWEKEHKEEVEPTDIEITKDDITRLKNLAKQWEAK